MPKTRAGKLSVALACAVPVLFIIGVVSVNTLYKSVVAGDTSLDDFGSRPVLSISMLAALLCGISALVLGLFAAFRQKERSPAVYVVIALGLLLVFMLIGEFLSPH